jgi:hypothetical protein
VCSAVSSESDNAVAPGDWIVATKASRAMRQLVTGDLTRCSAQLPSLARCVLIPCILGPYPYLAEAFERDQEAICMRVPVRNSHTWRGRSSRRARQSYEHGACLDSEAFVIRMHRNDTTQSRILRSLRFPTAVPDHYCPALSTKLIIGANGKKQYAGTRWTPRWFIRATLMSSDAVVVW